MPEIIDLYDNARRIVKQSDKTLPVPSGLNRLYVHVWIMNKNGQFLLQQRVPTAKRSPNMWGHTGGGAQTGESSWDTCVRESFEELGLQLDINKSVWIGTFHRPTDFIDVWLVRNDVDISDLKLQRSEVQDVKWATREEIQQMQQNGAFVPPAIPGLNMVYSYLDMLGK